MLATVDCLKKVVNLMSAAFREIHSIHFWKPVCSKLNSQLADAVPTRFGEAVSRRLLASTKKRKKKVELVFRQFSVLFL